ncbi:methyltransferase domain-containing protein [Amycolatopsis sp. NPDC059657]|uniref:methyltransferase domain-containing protein n=1 Tax=Amycolatopsis sp. NPDC059657 TaxID=3346899 RepID=UPI00366C9DBD
MVKMEAEGTDLEGPLMTTTALRWDARARDLADRLTKDGVLHDPAWRTALEATPRHVFVPSFYRKEPECWVAVAGTEDWLDTVYSDSVLVTAIARMPNGEQVPISSASEPSLMVRMLETLDIRDGHRVLEVGTGTGYNTALLSRRLGGDHVYSIDIGADLVEAARERLATLGHHPTLTVGHGAQGVVGQALFNRILVTCAVPAIPWAWAEQLAVNGLVLADLEAGSGAGSLVLLRRYPDRLEGRFLPDWASFVPMRDADTAPEPPPRPSRVDEGAICWTDIDPTLAEERVPYFLAHTLIPPVLSMGERDEWITFTARDGSWCEVRREPESDGKRMVCQGGPLRIWDRFVRTHRLWAALGRPAWDRFGLTVMADGFHRVWLDDPDGDFRWTLPPH